MDKLSFPKGSLKFNKLSNSNPNLEKTPDWKNYLTAYVLRKKYVDVMQKTYPGKKEDCKDIPKEVQQSFNVAIERLKDARKDFKNIPSFSTISNYEITFKHPKWYPIIGEIKVQSERMHVKDSLKRIAKEFKILKNKHRKLRTKSKTHKIASLRATINYDVSGGVIHMPTIKEGVYIKFLKEQEKQIVFSHKSPKDNSNYIGVELEFMCDAKQDKLGLMLFEAGVGKQVTLTEDGSLRCCDGREPGNCETHKDKHLHELNILVKEDNYKDILKKVCDVLHKVNAVVNKSCGMHVHLDMRTRDAEKAYQNLVSAQNILFAMNPKSRTEKYAKKISERNLDIAKNSGERYYGINSLALSKHKTIEIRIHSGTIDYTKITNWISILVKVANHSERVVKNYVSLTSFASQFEIDESLIGYMKERITKFKSKDDTTIEAERGVA